MRTGRLLLAGGLVWLLTACSKEAPPAPARDNPLDIHNPRTGGDPYGLRVESTPEGPRLRWSAVEMPGVAPACALWP